MIESAESVLQVSEAFPPYQLGGTEVYLEGLVWDLSRLGIISTVLVPRSADAPERYEHEGTSVETYFVNEVPAANELRDSKPHQGFEVFRARLSKNRGVIYHQHSWTRGCGPHHLRAARDLGLRTVLTIHVPNSICMRGTMMRFGTRACDGRVEATKCGACWAEGRGMPRSMAQSIAHLPLGIATLARCGKSRLATALAARALGADKLRNVREMIENADRIVAVCQWLHDALAANGVPADKLILSRQGIARDVLQATTAAARVGLGRSAPLKLLYLGRWDAVKGIDVIVQAMRSLARDVAVNLTIRGITGRHGDRAYEATIRRLAETDARIVIEGPIPHSDVASAMSGYDVLLVPSVLLETGPLVALEAQAAGLFVLGSRLGGIAEIVDECDAGELVEFGNVAAWSAAIERLARLYSNGALPRPSRPVRAMSLVADDMADLYRSL
jgi:glycosyltransferase involved in cell wall biosynthesis